MRARVLLVTAVASVAIAAMVLAGPSAVAQSIDEGPVCANVTGDAECNDVAVSGTGNASGGVAVSGTGDARADLAAVSGTGDATACRLIACVAVAPFGDATADIPVSVTGGCRDNPGRSYVPCAEATVFEDAEGYYSSASLTGNTSCRTSLCVTASGTGGAEAQMLAASGTGHAGKGFFTASGTGDAKAEILALTGTGDASAPMPVSATGDCRERSGDAYRPCTDLQPSSDARGHHAAVSGTGSAEGCVAVSGQREAESGCSELFEVGDAECEPHPPIRITERVGERGFEWVNPATGERELRPGSGVVRGNGTEANPYVIEGWCIQATPSWAGVGFEQSFDAALAGIAIAATEAHVRVQDSFVYGVTPGVQFAVFEHLTRGIAVAEASNVTIADNEIAYHDRGITVRWDASETRIVNNTVRQNVRDGIYVQNSHRTLVAENAVLENVRRGIFIDEVGRQNVVRENDVRRNNQEGIRLESDRFPSKAVDNNVENNTDGIFVTDPARVHHNRVVENNFLGIYSFGRNVTIHNNTVLENSREGIVLSFAENNQVMHNLVRGHSETGIRVGLGSTNSSVRANNVTDHPEGVVVNEAEQVSVRENNLWGNEGWGLTVQGVNEPVNATDNWWGCPGGPSAEACDGVEGPAVVDPWLTSPNPTAGVLGR